MGSDPISWQKGPDLKLAAALACALVLAGVHGHAADAAPFTVKRGLFKQRKPDLGLRAIPQGETVTIFKPQSGEDQFNNGVVLIPFKGRLYAQWQSSPRDEDTQDTWVAYSVSDDGTHWSKPAVLAPVAPAPQMHSNGGWWTDGETLVAYIAVWPTGFQSGDGGYTDFIQSTDGEHWTAPRRITGADGEPVPGIIEQDPHVLPGGRIVVAFHTRPGLIVAPFFTDDPLGVSGWRRGAMQNLPYEDHASSRELEPSLFLRGSCAVMVFRDQASTHRQLASESCDAAESWTQPVLTAMPDSRAKQSAGNLPNGTAYLVNAPRDGKPRIPLAITLSDDGRKFDRAWALRGEASLQPMRVEGRYKRAGFHYPKSVIWKDHLYVSYATNKEDVELTRMPLAELGSDPIS